MFMNVLRPPLLVLFDANTAVKSRIKDEVQRDEPMKKALVCAACKAEITFNEARIQVKGGHEHSFFNPYGIVYHIGCFSVAPGCRPASEPSTEFTWFPGYAWRIVCCYRCQAHLGWSFSKQGAVAFYGLVLDRLVEALEKEPYPRDP